jgi:hypothetical protein
MIEYLYDAIRATSGQDVPVYATFANDDGTFVSEGVVFMLHKPDGSHLVTVEGTCNMETGQWTFNVPGEATKGHKGHYLYCFQQAGSNLCFLSPYYLM